MTALIFDLDGTLADTAPDLLAATNAVLAARGRTAIDPASLRHMVGFGARSLIEQAFTATAAPAAETELPALVDIFVNHYRAHIADHTRLFPQVAETLEALKGDGARLAILTNKPQELTDLLVPRLGIAGLFDAVWGAGRMSYTKPDPRIFHDVVAACGGGPAIMIGDSITDLNTGRAAGAKVILMSYGYTPVAASELGADIVLDDFSALGDAMTALL